ncbi:GNAT family N-acetyltransferase [Paenibacillus sp. OV219]|uniref:GNAT family N-acetyltransferase n=1 Tax=Paenibacillus sp. OV219 TaxID=1884377 RepID=UPI0008B8514A|nr:GNAT family N-acetyltransferase [Paenibacillus sp. OV219]SEO93718.1 Ribosomal protein S18 acetylase RimI [Paenibacillus sp. OV219]
MGIQLEKVTTDHADFGYLIELLDRDLWNRYPDTQQFFHGFNQVKLGAKAIVAYVDNKPVGCGCYREAEEAGIVEMKRMFVLEEVRGRGIARAIMNELEQWAKQEGNRRAILETGTGQPEAIALYTKLGYVQIENYEPYIGSEDSVCMGKDL